MRRTCFIRVSRDQSGHALVEFSFVVLILAVLIFALIDFSRAISTRQVLTNLSREAANLASRGTSLSNTLVAVKASAQPLDIDQKGYVILSVVHRDNASNATVTVQLTGGGVPSASRVATAGVGRPPTLPPTPELLPQPNRTLHVAEVFYRFAPVTPVGQLLGLVLPTTQYDVAYF